MELGQLVRAMEEVAEVAAQVISSLGRDVVEVDTVSDCVHHYTRQRERESIRTCYINYFPYRHLWKNMIKWKLLRLNKIVELALQYILSQELMIYGRESSREWRFV